MVAKPEGARSVWPAFAAVAAVAVLPYVELVAANPSESIDHPRLGALAALTLAVVLLPVWVAGRLSQAAAHRAAVIVAVLAWLFFHVPTVEGWWDAVGLYGPTHVRWLILAALALTLLVPVSGARRVQQWLFMVAPAILLVSLVPAVLVTTADGAAALTTVPDVEVGRVTRPTNVYFFPTDGYGRHDVIADETGLDIQRFLQELTELGFTVSRDAKANYPATFLSIASTLSMTYVQETGDRRSDPVFLFAHLLSPHPPFTREADCSLRTGFSYNEASWGNPDGYAGQVTCLNQQLLAAMDRILAEDPDPVIIIQSDHGTQFAYEPEQRLPILSAVRLPRACRGAVPDDLTPVNTFRIVLNCLTSSDLDLLPNRHFWVEYGNPAVRELDQ